MGNSFATREISRALMDEQAKTQLLYDHFNYILSMDAQGNYDLEIVANHSAAYYMVKHRLTGEEVRLYKQRGKTFIDDLANRYRHHGQ